MNSKVSEREIRALGAEGLRNRQIAERFFKSEKTVKAHIKHLWNKLEASDRTQAVSIAARRDIIEL